MTTTTTYEVQIIDRKTREIVKRIPCGESLRRAQKTERGVDMQLGDGYVSCIEIIKEKNGGPK